MPSSDLLEKIESYFSAQGWTSLPFQREAWESYLKGHSGLIHVPTGSGKTLAAFAAALLQVEPKQGLQIVYVTPLRSLIRDIEAALIHYLDFFDIKIILETRTGDTSTTIRRRQQKRLPDVLLTTPESLSLLMTRRDFAELFKKTRLVVIDEWHELLSTKRGTQVELAVSHLKTPAPKLRVWALSGTLRNLEEATRAAVGIDRHPHLISQKLSRPVEVETLLPPKVSDFPWAGHLGLKLLPVLLENLREESSTLIFTNTRSQAELWFQAILEARSDMAGRLGLHHGSLDPKQRQFVENSLKSGEMRWVVCTSSLDLGVDFGPVEQVVQIGSPKGIARIMQRAGRAQHRPQESCRILCLPTHALQLAEIAAVRRAIEKKDIEARSPILKPLDVLEQHIVTCALGGGISREELKQELHRSLSYENLRDEELDWAIRHVQDGGALKAYPDYLRVVEEDGRLVVTSPRIARMHRLNVGTITSDATVSLHFLSGGALGQVEESFVARLKRGDVFLFNGRNLEFVRLQDMKAYVRLSRRRAELTPRWQGGKLPLSDSLAAELREVLRLCRAHEYRGPEANFLQEILAIQEKLSRIPQAKTALLETIRSREGYHAFLFPFEGRWVHQGLAAILALRLAKLKPMTFSISINDYGLEFLAGEPFPYERYLLDPEIYRDANLLADAQESMNLSELAKRQFREVARVAGLIFQSYPGSGKSAKQLQASSSLLFDVLKNHEPENRLLHQSEQEVMDRHFEMRRLQQTLHRLQEYGVEWTSPKRLTPLALPLVVERLGSSRLSTESLSKRLARIQESWTKD